MVINIKEPENFVYKQWSDFLHFDKPYTILITGAETDSDPAVIAQVPMIQKVSFNETDIKLLRKVLPQEKSIIVSIDSSEFTSVYIEKQRKDIILELIK